MDLLFKNPKYFFDTYFNVSIWLFILVVAVIFAFGIMIKFVRKSKISRKSVIIEVLFSIYMATVITITLMGENRQLIGDLILDPFYEIERAVFQSDIHAKREIISNILFFVPFGFLFPLNYNFKTLKTVLVFGFCLSALIEILQFLFKLGFAQTADILDNVIGALFGWLLLKIVQKFIHKHKKWRKL